MWIAAQRNKQNNSNSMDKTRDAIERARKMRNQNG